MEDKLSHIRIHQSTKSKLENLKNDNESYEKVVNNLLSEDEIYFTTKGYNINVYFEGENRKGILKTPEERACFLLGALTSKALTVKLTKNYKLLDEIQKFRGDYDSFKKLFVKVIKELESNNRSQPELEACLAENLVRSLDKWEINRDEAKYYFTIGQTIHYKK
jgi:hypothetical protein